MMNAPIPVEERPVSLLAQFFQMMRPYYASYGIQLQSVIEGELGQIDYTDMPCLMITELSFHTEPKGMPDLFEETFVCRILGAITHSDPNSLHALRYQFGQATKTFLTRLPHYLRLRDSLFYTTEQWFSDIEYGSMTLVGNTIVDGFLIDVRLKRLAIYALPEAPPLKPDTSREVIGEP